MDAYLCFSCRKRMTFEEIEVREEPRSFCSDRCHQTYLDFTEVMHLRPSLHNSQCAAIRRKKKEKQKQKEERQKKLEQRAKEKTVEITATIRNFMVAEPGKCIPRWWG